jgi:hypothetical protein
MRPLFAWTPRPLLGPLFGRFGFTCNLRAIEAGSRIEVCRKCAVRFEPICANTGFFATSVKCFRAGLVRVNRERGRNRTFNLLIESRNSSNAFLKTGHPMGSCIALQALAKLGMLL